MMMRRWRLLIWLLPLLLPLLLWQRGGELSLDVGRSADTAWLHGFHDPESNDFYDYEYRWSTDVAEIALPSYGATLIVAINGAVVPDGTLVTLHNNDQSVILPVNQGDLALRQYRVFWPNADDLLGRSTIQITAQLSPAPAEARPLGLLVDAVTLRSLSTGWRWPPLAMWLLLAALAWVIALGLWLLRVPSGLATFISLGASSAITLTWALRPIWVQPWLLTLVTGLALIAGSAWWMQQVQQRLVLRLPVLLLIFVVIAGLIPIYSWQEYGFTRWELWLPIVALALALPVPFVPRSVRRWLVGAIVLALLVYGVQSYVYAFVKDYADDFTALFRGPRAFLRSESLYKLDEIGANPFGNSYKYPPFFVLLMGPLTGLPYTPAIQIWRALNLLALIGAAVLLWRGNGRRWRSWSTAGLLLLLLTFQPLTDTLRYGQVDLLILLALAAAVYALSRDRWTWWGAILAVPTLLKLYPAYLLLHAVVWRRWRAISVFAATAAMLTAISVIGLGWPVHLTYLREVLPISGGGTLWVENQTFNGWFNRFTTGVIGLQPDQMGWQRLATYAAFGLMTVLTAWCSRAMTVIAGFELWIITMLLVLPATWIHYEVVLLIPFYHLFVRLEDRTIAWRSLVLYALAWMLLCYGNQWTFFQRINYGPLWGLILSYKFYGLLLLWAALAFDPTARLKSTATVEVKRVAPQRHTAIP